MTLTRTLICLMATLMVLSLASARADENTNAPSIKPVSMVPLMAKAPKIDGVIDPNEWNTLHVARFVSQGGDFLQNRPGEFWVGSDGKKLYIAVRTGVHPTAGVVAKVPVPPGKKDESGTVFDDSIELWFNNDPSGKGGQYYQIMVNSLGAIYDAMFEMKDKVGLTFWRVDMEQAHKVENGLWTAEFAIDLASINVTDATKPLAIRVCRNYKYPWDQSRWAPNVRSFDSPETMALVQFVKDAPIISEAGFQDADGINVAIDVTNPTAAALPLHVKLGHNAENQPRYYKDANIVLKPGETQRVEYKVKLFTEEDFPALGSIYVASGDDKTVYYHRDFKWHTKPKGPIWQPLGAVSAEEATQFDIEFHPTPKLLRWRVSFENMKDKEKVQDVRVVVVDEKQNKVAEYIARGLQGFKTEQRQTFDKLADGRYEAQVFLDTDKPAAEPVKKAVFDYLTNFPWLNNKIGVSDKVIPPFTPLEVKGNVVSAVLREHTMADTGLWQQVKADGQDILAGPMRLEMTCGGKVETAKGEVKIASAKPHAVTAESTWSVGRIAGKTTSEMEYDGCMKVTLEFERPAAPALDKMSAPIDNFSLVIPLNDKLAPLMHCCGDGLRINYAGKVPEGNGVVWSSDKASRQQILGTFLPYIWIGGEERGLCWFAASDQDWVLDFKEKTPALQLERKDGVLSLRVNIIQTPTVLDRPHKIVFGLQATPTRPMPQNPNWRTWGCVSAGKFDVTVLGMCGYWGGQLYSVFPRERDFTIVQKIADAKKNAKVDKEFFDAYAKKYPAIKAEVMWSANASKEQAIMPYTNIRGCVTYTPEWRVYQDEWQRGNFHTRMIKTDANDGGLDFVVVVPPSRRDFLMYYYREFLKNGFDGIYWDNICIYSNDNAIVSAGYTRQDGSFQPGCDIWDLREVTKRMAVLCDEMGKININMPHMTNALLVPVFSWTGMNLDWEWKYGGTDFQERFTRDYIRATGIGRQCGGVPIVLQGITEVKDANVMKWVERTRIAVCVPHEIKVWQTDALFGKLTKKLFEIGYGEDAKVYNYWDEKPVLKAEGLDLATLVVEGKDTVAVFVGDYGDGGKGKITLDTDRLGLAKDFTAVNYEDDKDATAAANGVLEVKDLKKHDFRMWLIAKKK